MAWTIRRSYNHFASRLRSSSLFLLTTPAAATTFLDSKRLRRDGGYRHYNSGISRTSTSRLYSYQEFLQQQEHDKIVVSYFTDIEGDKFYLDRYVDNSKILTWITAEQQQGGKEENPPLSLYSSSDQNCSNFPYDRRIDFCDSNSMLVFGGDLWDKGGFDLYVTRQLLDLKRRYPNRVVWVLGNRDINKLRIPQELGLPPRPSSTAVSVPYHPGLNWFRGSGRVGDPDGPLPSSEPGERLKWILGNTMGSPDAMEHRRQELAWEAKGCRDDNSRNGGDSDDEPKISDLDVVRSYQESCHPRGEMGQFLSQSLLAAQVGPILFVHGSLPLTKDVMADAKRRKQDESKNSSLWDDLTFCMPWINKTHYDYDDDYKCSTASDLGVETIEDWLESVNRFCCDNVEAWKNDIARLEESDDQDDENYKEESKNSIWAYRAGYGNGPSYSGLHYSDLVQYGVGMIPGGKKNPTVVYNSFTPEGMPTFFLPVEEQPNDDEEDEASSSESSRQEMSDVAICTREFFERSSMQLILTGHKPQGDMPSPIRVDKSSWVICADTSYSGDTKWWHDDGNATTTENMERRSNLGRGNSISFRGDTAVSEVLVELSKGATSLESVRYHGVLSDGTEYESVNLLEADDSFQNGKSSASLGQVAPTSVVPEASDSPHEGRWWTKGICRDGSHLYYAGEGYNVWNYIVSSNSTTNNDGNNS